jgi:predicted metalloprotease
VRWDRSHQSSNLDDRRAQGPARGAGGLGGLGGGNVVGIFSLLSRFGWKGIAIGVVLAAVLFGTNLCGGLGGGSSSQRGAVATTPAEDEQVKFVGFVFDDAQTYWHGAWSSYRPAKIVVFRGAVESACGTTSSAVGPFYCPIDKQVYIDLAFYGDLDRRFGAPGDFAQAYVIGHELGHHVQNLRGLMGGGEVDSVEVELQADCLAGAWARDAEKRGLLEIGDVEEALGAAAAIGDDTIQRKTQGRVQPETWTHGSSAQRVAALRRGIQGGPDACGL